MEKAGGDNREGNGHSPTEPARAHANGSQTGKQADSNFSTEGEGPGKSTSRDLQGHGKLEGHRQWEEGHNHAKNRRTSTVPE